MSDCRAQSGQLAGNPSINDTIYRCRDDLPAAEIPKLAHAHEWAALRARGIHHCVRRDRLPTPFARHPLYLCEMRWTANLASNPLSEQHGSAPRAGVRVDPTRRFPTRRCPALCTHR
jgi:hypothetical protein